MEHNSFRLHKIMHNKLETRPAMEIPATSLMIIQHPFAFLEGASPGSKLNTSHQPPGTRKELSAYIEFMKETFKTGTMANYKVTSAGGAFAFIRHNALFYPLLPSGYVFSKAFLLFLLLPFTLRELSRGY